MTGIIFGPFRCTSVFVGGPCPRTVQVTSTVDPDQTLFESVVGNNKVTLSISLPTPVTLAR